MPFGLKNALAYFLDGQGLRGAERFAKCYIMLYGSHPGGADSLEDGGTGG